MASELLLPLILKLIGSKDPSTVDFEVTVRRHGMTIMLSDEGCYLGLPPGQADLDDIEWAQSLCERLAGPINQIEGWGTDGKADPR